MADYISREAFKRKYLCCGYLPEMSEDEFDKFPAADVAPVVHGRFVMDETTYAGVAVANYKCSECGENNGTWLRILPADKMPRFCKWCGAKMDGREE